MNIPPELVGITPAILIIVQLAKKAGLSTKYLPLVSLVLGVIGAVILNVGGSVIGNIILGIMAGGSASGIYDAGEAVMNKKKAIDTPAQ